MSHFFVDNVDNNILRGCEHTKALSTLRESLPLSRFATVAQLNRCPNVGTTVFHMEPVPNLKLWTEVYHSVKQNVECKRVENTVSMQSSSCKTKQAFLIMFSIKKVEKSAYKSLNFYHSTLFVNTSLVRLWGFNFVFLCQKLNLFH